VTRTGSAPDLFGAGLLGRHLLLLALGGAVDAAAGDATSGQRALRTLIVDDDEPLRTLVKLTVEDDGRFDVVGEARNGKEAIEMAQALRPDVVLLDLKMPVMDGFQALPRIREAVPSARVVCLSMLQGRETAPKVLALGAVAFIDKGLPGPTFISRLVDVLRRAPGPAPPA
jgi:DNA-binding NarL/FixJ family response regulator